MKANEVVHATADASTTTFSDMVNRGFSFLLEFGDACADPTPASGYYCRGILAARQAYRAHKHEGEMFSLKAIGAFGFESKASGWVS